MSRLRSQLKRHLTYANIAATLALLLAVGGTGAYAGTLITSKQIKNGTIKNVDIHSNTIQSSKIADGTIQIADLAASAQSLAAAHYIGSLSGVTISTVMVQTQIDSVSIPQTGSYLITATGVVANSDTSNPADVTCDLIAGSDDKTTVVGLQPAVTGNISYLPITIQTVASLTDADSAVLWCVTDVAGVTVIFPQVTAVTVDSQSEIVSN